MNRYGTVIIFLSFCRNYSMLINDELKNKQPICWKTVDYGYRVEPKLKRNAKHASSFMSNVSIKAKHCSKFIKVGYVHVGAIWRIKIRDSKTASVRQS